MKKSNIAVLMLSATIICFSSCGGRRDTGRTYMPDMGKSRAVETYAFRDTAFFTGDIGQKGGNIIFYNSMPVKGTLKRGDLFPYDISNDSAGYKMSATVKNPLSDTLGVAVLKEAGRLFNINCAICHGATGAGNGPLATSGKVGGIANLTLPNYVALSDGTMFHVITYGKGVMGSYASQLNKEQRWQVIKYVRTLQNPSSDKAADSTSTKGALDSTVAKKG
ncbi:MAG: cytochrome c [Ferruginibacter sp.]